MPKNAVSARKRSVASLSPVSPRLEALGLDRGTLARLYRTMVMARRMDDAEITMKKRNQVFFQISGAGHEAIQVAVAHVLEAGRDWFLLYYRDRALALGLGATPLDILLQSVGAADDPHSAGRQMPCHFSMPREHVVSTSSPTGTQCNQGVGLAEAGVIALRERLAGMDVTEGEVVLVTLGEGTTAEGEFHEAVNVAAIKRLPVLFLIEDNGYAISTPAEENIPGGDIAEAFRGLPGLTVETVDGTDVAASIEALRRLTGAMRRGEIGPVLLRAIVTRPYSHSLSDDQSLYRVEREIEDEAERDPVRRTAHLLLSEGGFTELDLETIRKDVENEIRGAITQALDAPKPDPDRAMGYLYAHENSPLDRTIYGLTEPILTGEPVPMGQALNMALHDEMERDSRIVVFGEDVADCSRREALDKCKGKGGVFKLTAGLQRRFGSNRCFNGTLAEASLVGRAVGMAVRGLKPVVEVQFFDYIWPAMMQLRGELATMRWRSGNGWAAPVVVRVPIGGYLRGGGPYHSQSGENIFVQCPGLRIAYPSRGRDAVGLLRTAMRCDDPVLFLEHKHLYYQTHNRDPYPGPDYSIPFGQASVVREGRDVTVVTWGAVVHKAVEAAQQLAEQDGYEAEVIDLRTLVPLDEETIFNSIRKTHRVVIASEEGITGGFGGEIAALIAEHCFEWLDAPVRRVAALPCWVAYSPVVEERVLPQTSDVLQALQELTRY